MVVRLGCLPKSNNRLGFCHSRLRGRLEFGVLLRLGVVLLGAFRAFAMRVLVSFRVLLNGSSFHLILFVSARQGVGAFRGGGNAR
jgi:hypothetical protein